MNYRMKFSAAMAYALALLVGLPSVVPHWGVSSCSCQLGLDAGGSGIRQMFR